MMVQYQWQMMYFTQLPQYMRCSVLAFFYFDCYLKKRLLG